MPNIASWTQTLFPSKMLKFLRKEIFTLPSTDFPYGKSACDKSVVIEEL
jgi:hypothetical protein